MEISLLLIIVIQGFLKNIPIEIRQIYDNYNFKTKISKLFRFWGKYVEIEQIILKSKSKFEQLGLKEITFDPKTLVNDGETNPTGIIFTVVNGLFVTSFFAVSDETR